MSETRSKGMQIIRMVMLMMGAVGLFSAGLVGTLGMRGKLNKQYLGPLVGMEVEETEPSVEELHELMAARPSNPEHASSGEDHTTASSAAGASEHRSAGLLPEINLPSPFSGDETRMLFDELLNTRRDLRERVARLERERKDLELVRIDLNHRWDELNRREEALEELARSLDGERTNLDEERTKIDDRTTSLDDTERKNIEVLASHVEKMKPDAAAALLMEKDPDQAALILSYIKAREAGKILAAMPPAYAADVTDRMLGVLKPRAGQEGGGP